MKHDSEILKRIKSYFMRRKSAQEAHLFEREIERDPFLYEAMEGFESMLTSDLQQAMDELDERLEKTSKKRTIAITWQAAAVVAVIIAGSIVFSLMGRMNAPIEVAAPTYDPRDSHFIHNKANSVGPSEKADSTDAIDIAVASAPDSPPIVDQKVVEAVPSINRDLPKKVEKASEPTTEIAAVETSEDVFEEDTESMNYTRSLNPSATKNPATTEDVAEIVSEASQVSMDKKASTSPSVKKPQPVGGMPAYQQYLKNNLKKSGNMPAGGVVVTFEVDKDGTPKKIAVANSLCTACDAEAVRVVQNGPKWTTENKKERISVTVPFD